MPKTFGSRLAAVLTFVALVCSCLAAQAQTTYHVRIPVGELRDQGTFAVDFQLTDGDFSGNDNARAHVFNLTLTGGTLGTALPRIGNASGEPTETPTAPLILRDGTASPVADFAQEFTVQSASAELHFDVMLSSTSVEPLVPDNFSVFILDGAYVPLESTGAFGIELLTADYTTLTPTPIGYNLLKPESVQATVTTAGILSSLSASISLVGIQDGTGTVRLTANAPVGGRVVSLVSSQPSVVSVPALVTVPNGQSFADFAFQTSPVSVETEVTLTAQIGGETRQVTVTVLPLLESFTLEPGRTLSGNALTGTVRLRAAAPQDVTITLQSGADELVDVPASVTVPDSLSSATFPIEIGTIGAVTDVILRATFGTDTRLLTVKVYPTPQYTLLDLGTLGGLNSTPTAINAAGQIVGYADTEIGDTHAFLFDGSTLLDLGTLGGQTSQARALNNKGMIVGEAQNSLFDTVGFVYAEGVMASGFADGVLGTLRAVNDSGWSVGSLVDSNFNPTPVLRTADGTMQPLGHLGGEIGEAFGINALGQIVGRSQNTFLEDRAFLYSRGTMRDLGTLGGISSVAHGLNQGGLVVGQSELTNGDWRAFLYADGTMNDLGTLGGLNSAAWSINDNGLIVGAADTELLESHAALSIQGQWFDLNAVTANLNSRTLTQAVGVNASGQIAALTENNGEQRAVRLDPVVPPGLRTISGTLTLNGTPNATRSFVFQFRALDGTAMFQQNVQTTANGSFQVVGIPPGSYLLSILLPNWLRRTVTADVQANDIAGLNTALFGGDVNEDNVVDITDLLELIAVYNKTLLGSPAGYSVAADFNADNANDITDLLLLIGSYNRSGDP
jgi:probable HAF family extracellular repeat protein